MNVAGIFLPPLKSLMSKTTITVGFKNPPQNLVASISTKLSDLKRYNYSRTVVKTLQEKPNQST